MRTVQSFGEAGVETVWKIRDTARKVDKGQTGLKCPAEKLASSGYMVSDL